MYICIWTAYLDILSLIDQVQGITFANASMLMPGIHYLYQEHFKGVAFFAKRIGPVGTRLPQPACAQPNASWTWNENHQPKQKHNKTETK